ncbi:MAG TPA: bifunctional phosphoglucose/phosphomannose isomerase [Acidobacteriota bacterium]|jgi:glucose/mannose-6-phosphate isomerase
MTNSAAAAIRLLDDVRAMDRIDRSGMLDLLARFPDQILQADQLGEAFTFDATAPLRNVLITGLGGSAIGGEIVQALTAGHAAVPVLVNRDYQLPAFVGKETLLVACSYSGNTEETLAAYQSAACSGAQRVAITSGGKLRDLARRDGAAVLEIPGGNPPRTAIAYCVFPLLWILHRTGICQMQSETARVAAAGAREMQQKCDPGVPAPDNPAKHIALQLQGKLAVIYAPAAPLGAVGTRWKGQLSENAKSLALQNVLPEMNHNEIVGWKHPEWIRNAFVICLRDKEEHPQVGKRFDFLEERLQRTGVTVEQLWGRGDLLASRIFSLITLGDYASVYLAFLYQEDPTPVEVIEELKQKLKGA